MKMNIILNQSNKNTQNAVNRIQSSLNKLQSAINNNPNVTNRNANTNKNKSIRRKFIDTQNNYPMTNNVVMTEANIEQKPIIGYSMFNNNSVLRTDKKNIQQSLNPQDLNKFNFERITNNKIEYIPKTNVSRNNKNYSNNKKLNSVLKWKCINCGNINLLYNKFCINCGKTNTKNENLNNTNYIKKDNKINYINNSYENINNNYNINNSHFITNNNTINNSNLYDNNDIISNEYNSYNPKQKDNNANKQNLAYSVFDNRLKPFNPVINSDKNIFDDNIDNSNLTGITDSNNNKAFNISIPYNETNNNTKDINLIYKKLNDLYLYGDYLENELKESNDENIKLLEKYKNIKNDVHNLNQKNKKLKQNISDLQKKESELNKLNDQLKNGFSFVQQKVEKLDNDNLSVLKELEIENNKNLQKQKNYDNEIETLKKKINLLMKDDEENNEEEKNMAEMENNIEKDKKEILENNSKYILLLKDNEILNSDIEQLQKKLESNANNEKLNGNEPPNLLKKLDSLKNQMLLFDKEIKQNKMMTNNLINEYKDLIEISENAMNNNDNKINENDKNEYLLIKEKNNKLTNELSKLKNIIKNLKDSKEKIIEIYEDEINKLNNFHKKAKEKTMNNKKEKVNTEIDEEKLMKIIHENEEIKNENFELIKDLDKLAELQKIYQGLIDENSKLKNELKDSDLNEENQKSLNDAIGDDNLNEEEENKNDSN